jgi:hypothetical protein
MDVLLVTATWRQDLDRFRLLRRSLREVGATESFRHVVAIHSEDLELVDDLRSEPNLEIVPTRDLLGQRIEHRRAAAHFPRASWRHWVPGGPIAGWYAQQLTKLAAVSHAGGAQAVVFVDSDLVALRPLERSDFIAPSGSTRFFVSADMRDDDSADWNRAAARLLNVSQDLVDRRQFIHAPAVVDVAVARSMLGALETGAAPNRWQSTMLAANAFEYPTYGAWVMGGCLDQVEMSEPMPTVNFNEYEQMWDFKQRATRIIAEGEAKFLSVQSRLHIPPASYEPIVSTAWRR